MSLLAEAVRSRYVDPLARIDWDSVDRACWWLPPDALSLAGIPAFEALPAGLRRRVSHLEYVHLLEAGLWLESLFMSRMAALAHRSGDIARRARLLEEVREEAGHSLMFVELLHRSGFGVASGQGAVLRATDALARLLPASSALFWAMVVAGEELPDRLNRRLQRGVEDFVLSAVVYHVARTHIRDEALHAAYARGQCADATQRCPRWRRRMLSPALSRMIDLYAGYLYFPPATTYERAGLVPGEAWRARALANPVRRAEVAAMLRPTLDFLRRVGWPVTSRFGA